MFLINLVVDWNKPPYIYLREVEIFRCEVISSIVLSNDGVLNRKNFIIPPH